MDAPKSCELIGVPPATGGISQARKIGTDMHIIHAPLPPKCCNHHPTLRVRPRMVYDTLIAYVRYECKECGCTGTISITEPEARMLWEPDHPAINAER